MGAPLDFPLELLVSGPFKVYFLFSHLSLCSFPLSQAFVGERATLFCYIMDQIKQQVGLGTASPGVGTLTLIIQSGVLLGSAVRARGATAQVWLLDNLCARSGMCYPVTPKGWSQHFLGGSQ